MMRTNKFFSPTGKLKWLSTLVVFFTSLFISYSQEVLLEMGSNPSLTAKQASLKNSKKRFSKLNNFLMELGLRGLGILNYQNFEISGEKF